MIIEKTRSDGNGDEIECDVTMLEACIPPATAASMTVADGLKDTAQCKGNRVEEFDAIRN